MISWSQMHSWSTYPIKSSNDSTLHLAKNSKIRWIRCRHFNATSKFYPSFALPSRKKSRKWSNNRCSSSNSSTRKLISSASSLKKLKSTRRASLTWRAGLEWETKRANNSKQSRRNLSKKRNIARVLNALQKSTKAKFKKARIRCRNLTIRSASLMTPLQRPSTGTRASRSISRSWRKKLESSKGHSSMVLWPWVIKISRSNV